MLRSPLSWLKQRIHAALSSELRALNATFITLSIGMLTQIVVALNHGGRVAALALGLLVPCAMTLRLLVPAFRPHVVRAPFSELRLSADTASRPALLAGCFNPAHEGHLKLVRFLASQHARVLLAVHSKTARRSDVGAGTRAALLRSMLAAEGLKNVDVEVCRGHACLLGLSRGASVMYRGVRSWKEEAVDEFREHALNQLRPPLRAGRLPLPTTFLEASAEDSRLTSSRVRVRCSACIHVTDVEKALGGLVPSGQEQAVWRAYGPGQTT